MFRQLVLKKFWVAETGIEFQYLTTELLLSVVYKKYTIEELRKVVQLHFYISVHFRVTLVK